MVKVAVAGGSGNFAQEIIDVLVATQRHEVVLLSRKDPPASSTTERLKWVKADYDDPEQLAHALQGVHTVLSFAATQDDPMSTAQKNLIDASIKAGVKRFAPSEWGASGLDHMAWYTYKATPRRYLEELNKDHKVLEYTLFQPGMLMNYLTHPYKSTKHMHPMEMPFDFNNRRAIILEGGENDRLSITTIQDFTNVVIQAIEYEGEWPRVSGVTGASMTVGQIIALGEKIRGAPFKVETVAAADLESGAWKTSWLPKLEHPSNPPEQLEKFSRIILAGFLLAISAKAWSTSDEWNQLLPDQKFTQPDEFLSKAWSGKP